MNIQLANIQLPERSVTNILSILESNNMPARLPDGDGWDFNCWGFTAYYFQWIDKAYWMDAGQMKAYLEVRTNPIRKKDAKAGDIAVFHKGSYLTHTAVLLPEANAVCHKPGATPLCIDTIDAASYSYGDVTYVRALEKKSDETI